jgi:hypothetical protein
MNNARGGIESGVVKQFSDLHVDANFFACAMQEGIPAIFHNNLWNPQKTEVL